MRAYIFAEHFLAVSSHIPPALSQLALSVDLLMSPAAAELGGEELCSFAPVDVSLLVPAAWGNRPRDTRAGSRRLRGREWVLGRDLALQAR